LIESIKKSTLLQGRYCPFQCEFCDIIVTFGRRPRLKIAEQVIKEVETLYAQGLGDVFIADDNSAVIKMGLDPSFKNLLIGKGRGNIRSYSPRKQRST
jgi:radical SAM superfamily enzyme YgiQ (UPF0313 family)